MEPIAKHANPVPYCNAPIFIFAFNENCFKYNILKLYNSIK